MTLLEKVNSYRLTSMEEPSEEILSYIMCEAALEAKMKSEQAHKAMFDDLREQAKLIHKQYKYLYDKRS